MLSEMGVQSSLIRDSNFLVDPLAFDDNVFYNVTVPVSPFGFSEAGNYLENEDVLVLPKVLLDRTLPTCAPWRCRIAVNNQNGFFHFTLPPSKIAACEADRICDSQCSLRCCDQSSFPRHRSEARLSCALLGHASTVRDEGRYWESETCDLLHAA